VTTSPITAVVFDLGAVLVDWNPEYLYVKLIPDNAERRRFLTEVCTLEWNYTMDGGLSVRECVAALAAEHPDQADLVNAWWDRWPEMLGDEIPGTRAVAEAISASGMPLYALTNWSSETWPLGLARFPFLAELFDGIVVSGDEGVAKPDPRLFEIMNERYGLEPTTTVFIDDSSTNVAAASALGYHAHLFTTAEDLAARLDELGVLPQR
jgi:2-haloacid dehalogenase